MDRDKRSTITRYRIAAWIVLGLCLAGCGGNASVQSSGGGTISIGAQPRSGFGDLLAIGLMLGIVHGSEGFGPRVSTNPLMAIQPTQPAPGMDPARTVHEQDCSRPIENPSANLKCR